MMTKLSLAYGEDTALHNTFEAIYDRQCNMVYRVCFSYMKNAADAEDVVADVFLKLLESGKTFQSIEHEKAWLLRTAINKCKNLLKHWWRSRADIDDFENLESNDPLVENELLQTVWNLPVRYKDVIILYYYEGCSTAEVAQILKKPHSTIRNQLVEARKLLKGVLESEE